MAPLVLARWPKAFEVSPSGTLQNVQIVMAGAAATFNVELYNMGAYPGKLAFCHSRGAPTIAI